MRLVVLACLAGCLGPSTIECADGTECPQGLVCSPSGGLCIGSDQLDGCRDLAEGANCDASSIGEGTCFTGVCLATEWSAKVIVGNTTGASTTLVQLDSIAVDLFGNVYVTDLARLRRVDAATNTITTVAGTGSAGFSGDGGLATNAEITVSAVAVDGVGNVFIVDRGVKSIRRIDALTGVIDTILQPPQLTNPAAIATDGLGNLYIADDATAPLVVYYDVTAGTLLPIAGGGTSTGDGLALDAKLVTPAGLAVTTDGDLYIADRGTSLVRRVTGATITTIAGGGSGGDGGPAVDAALVGPSAVAIDAAGAVVIADTSNQCIRRVGVDGVITTIAGSLAHSGYGGDGGPATSALLSNPLAVAIDRAGNVFVDDTINHRIRRIDASTSIITTVAGTSRTGIGTAASSFDASITDAIPDPAGYLDLAFDHQIVRVDPVTRILAPVAGDGTAAASAAAPAGDGGLATIAQLAPSRLAFDAAGNLYVAELSRNRVRRIDSATGIISTVAGNGTAGIAGDGGPATSAQVNVSGIAVDAGGVLYISDTVNNLIRRVAGGTITTYAGDGTSTSTGDGGPASAAGIYAPSGLSVDAGGNLVIAEIGSGKVRRIDVATGLISTVAGGGGSLGDGGPATQGQLSLPDDVAVDGNDVVIADTNQQRVRFVTGGLISTLAGSDVSAFAGDGGLAVDATLKSPRNVAVDGSHGIYVTGHVVIDTEHHSDVRFIDPTSHRISTIVGQVDPPGMGTSSAAQLVDPRALVIGSSFSLIAGGTSGTLQSLAGDQLRVVAGRYPQATAIEPWARFRNNSYGPVGGVAFDATTNTIYVANSGGHRIDAITPVGQPETWTIAALTPGGAGYADGTVDAALFRDPTGLYLDGSVLYVADTGNHVIRAIDLATRSVTTIAGTPETLGYFGDGGPPREALLDQPQAITRCGADLFVADTGNHRVRRISGDTITTIVGDGVNASSGEGTPATSFPVSAPLGVACDGVGNLYVTSTNSVRLVRADAAGIVDGTGSTRTIYGKPPRDTFPASVTRCLTAVAVADANTLQITDACTGTLIELDRQPIP